MTTKELLRLFLLWQLILTALIGLSLFLLPLRETFIGGGTRAYGGNPFLYARANFDGNHYITIAQRGYGYAQQAFFPFYPNLLKILAPYAGNYALAGVIISAVAHLLGLVVLIKLIRLDYPQATAKYATWLLLLFPTAFYFGAVYTESLFLLLIVLAFYFARGGRWWLAGVCGALASYTRFVGILLLPALLIEFWWQNKKLTFKALPLLLAPLGLGFYMYYLRQTTGDPLAFWHALRLFGQFRSERVILLYQVFWRYLKMVWTVNRADPLYLTIWLEFVTGIVFLTASIYSFIKQRLSYAVFNLLAFLVPTLTGSFVSLPRYVLICFPVFILGGEMLRVHPRWRLLLLFISGAAGVVFFILFARGYWVG